MTELRSIPYHDPVDMLNALRNTVKLLIVDDEINIREGLRDCVDWKSLGIDEIRDAEDGKEALVEFTTFKPDIVLTDVVMSRMDGIELISSIREASAGTHIILMSAYQDFDYLKSAIKYDALDYLLKPIRTEELDEVISKAVKSIQNGREAGRSSADHVHEEDQLTHTDGNRTVARVQKFINENFYQQDLSIQSVANHVFLSANHLSHLYKEKTGSTVHDFILKRRHEQAKHLLRETNHRIRDIAQGVGYRDANYFTKCFRKIEGCTPREYRDTT